MFVNKDRRISAQKFKLESAYQNFDEAALQLVPIGHRRLCPASGAWLAYMIALGRRNRPLQHRLITRSYQTHFYTKHLTGTTQHIFRQHQVMFITGNSTICVDSINQQVTLHKTRGEALKTGSTARTANNTKHLNEVCSKSIKCENQCYEVGKIQSSNHEYGTFNDSRWFLFIIIIL